MPRAGAAASPDPGMSRSSPLRRRWPSTHPRVARRPAALARGGSARPRGRVAGLAGPLNGDATLEGPQRAFEVSLLLDRDAHCDVHLTHDLFEAALGSKV